MYRLKLKLKRNQKGIVLKGSIIESKASHRNKKGLMLREVGQSKIHIQSQIIKEMILKNIQNQIEMKKISMIILTK